MTTAQLTARSLSALLGHWQSEGTAAYRTLADRIRLLVLDGRILVGSRLPAERELAARLELSRSTVAAAYRALREAGYLTSVQGSGSVTRIPADTHDGERGGGPRGAFVASTASRDTAVDSDRPLLNFTQAALPASAGVSEAIQQAAADVAPLLETLGFELHGLPALREAIADRYTERGLPTEPGEIMVTGGALSALSLITRAFVARGDRVVVETPTYPHAADTLLAAGARLVPVGVSVDDGWNEDALLDALAQSAPALAYVMPDFHNPTGASMTPGFRRRLVAAAAATRTVLVADETTAELDIDRPAVAGDPYMPLAAYGDAVLIGSTSKTFWGGLRIGWIRAERAVIRRLLAARASVDIGTPVFEQLVATSLVRRTAELLPARQRQLRDGRDVLYSALEQRLPEWRRPPLAGGLCAWVNVGRPISSQLVLAARTYGVLFTAGPRFGTDGAFERFLRLPINYSPGDTRRAVEVLQRSWAELEGHPSGADLPEFADLV